MLSWKPARFFQPAVQERLLPPVVLLLFLSALLHELSGVRAAITNGLGTEALNPTMGSIQPVRTVEMTDRTCDKNALARIADDRFCDKYYVCSNDKYVGLFCPVGMAFDYGLQECRLRPSVDCSTRPLTSVGGLPLRQVSTEPPTTTTWPPSTTQQQVTMTTGLSSNVMKMPFGAKVIIPFGSTIFLPPGSQIEMQSGPEREEQSGHQHHRRSTISADEMVDDNDPATTRPPFPFQQENTSGTIADEGHDETADVDHVDNHNAELSDYYYVDDQDDDSGRQVDIPSPD